MEYLPSYEPVLAVAKKNKNHDAVVRVDCETRVVTLDDIVNGVVYINPVHTINLPCITIELIMQESVIRSKYDTDSRAVRTVRLDVTTIAHIENALDANMEYKFTFSLQTPNTIRNACPHNIKQHSQLPPSLGDISDAESTTNMPDQCSQISYCIRTRVYSDKSLSYEKLDQLKFWPTYPPTLHVNAPSYSTCKFSSGLLDRRPRVAKLELNNGSDIFTGQKSHIVKLRIDLNVEQPPNLLRVKFSLLAHTIVSPVQLSYVPRPDQRGLHTHTEAISQQTIEMTPRWSKSSPEWLSTTVPIPIILHSHPRFLPSFSSCMTTRTYSLSIKIPSLSSQLSCPLHVNASSSPHISI